jgi:hypothetical protein
MHITYRQLFRSYTSHIIHTLNLYFGKESCMAYNFLFPTYRKFSKKEKKIDSVRTDSKSFT